MKHVFYWPSLVASLSVKGNRESKEFLDILDLDFDFINNDHILNEDGDSTDSIDISSYDDPSSIDAIFNYEELKEFIENVLIDEIDMSISDLNELSSSTFTSTIEITPAMQGKVKTDNSGNEVLPSSSIYIDYIDVLALKSSLEFSKSALLYTLSQNFDIEGSTETGSGMKDLAVQWDGRKDDAFFEGSAEYAIPSTPGKPRRKLSDHNNTTLKSFLC